VCLGGLQDHLTVYHPPQRSPHTRTTIQASRPARARQHKIDNRLDTTSAAGSPTGRRSVPFPGVVAEQPSGRIGERSPRAAPLPRISGAEWPTLARAARTLPIWGMPKVPRTITAPARKLPPALHGSDLVTAIREYGRPREHALPCGRATFSIGSSSGCDVDVRDEYVSGIHCTLTRRGTRMWVQDQSSRNGTYVRGHQETTFLIVPGDTFSVATTRLLVVNENMRIARSSMAEVLGYNFDSAIDDLLTYSVQDRPMLIMGPTGAGQLDLVRAVHETSVRRDRELVLAHRVPAAREKQMQLVVHAQRGTLALQLTGRPVDKMFLDMVLSSDLHVRVVVLARSLQAASRSVDLDALTRMDILEIRPLQERQGDIRKLMDEQFQKSEMALTMKDLTIENQRALQAHRWPHNLDEIRRAAKNVLALVRAGSIRQAARSLHLPRSSLQYWLDRMDLRLPLTSGSIPVPMRDIESDG
jgi:hypothetical protein